MDVKLSGATASDVERAAVATVLGPEPPQAGRVVRAGRAQREQRHLLLPALHALQDSVGWVSRGAVDHLAERLGVAPAEIYGVASFYHLLATEPQPALAVHVCDDVACRAAGAGALLGQLGEAVQRSACLGLCDRGSAALVRRSGPPAERIDVAVAPVTALQVAGFLGGEAPPELAAADIPPPQAGKPGLRLLRRAAGEVITTVDDYEAAGGLAALRRALEQGPDWVLAEVKAAALVGRGGAAFPTARKWEAVLRAPSRPHYAVCNADESETGTFKDRVLLERDAFAVLESLAIAGFATGSKHGFLYVRDEYPLARARLQAAIEALRQAGWLGAAVGGPGFAFDVELRRGAGAYICGEETALFNSIEGRRGEPRNKPPFPVESGLFGQPTAVNNVETLVAVLEALRVGGSASTKLFCVSGAVVRPGVYEVELGTTLQALIELAGGLQPGRRLQAVLLGGAAGSLVGPSRLDLELSFEAARAAGLSLGSGAVVVLDESLDLSEVVLRIARFFREESCGQCVPCRVGTVRQEEALRRLFSGRPLGSREDELVRLSDVAEVMRDASICGLGQTAAIAVQSALRGLS